MPTSALRVLDSLEELAALVDGGPPLFVRWSRGPDVDIPRGGSRDDLTGSPLPGLSANSLAVEPWWGDRPVLVWVARRLYDYSHLPREKGPDVFPWVFTGEEVGRGPDNEPLVHCVKVVGRISEGTIEEAAATVENHGTSWGPLRRPAGG
ncbi:hypothetical protein GCM10027168_34510 [Streptomyces capparidis]